VRLIAPHRAAQGVYCQLPLAARDVALFMILVATCNAPARDPVG